MYSSQGSSCPLLHQLPICTILSHRERMYSLHRQYRRVSSVVLCTHFRLRNMNLRRAQLGHLEPDIHTMENTGWHQLAPTRPRLASTSSLHRRMRVCNETSSLMTAGMALQLQPLRWIASLRYRRAIPCRNNSDSRDLPRIDNGPRGVPARRLNQSTDRISSGRMDPV